MGDPFNNVIIPESPHSQWADWMEKIRTIAGSIITLALALNRVGNIFHLKTFT